MRLPLIAVVFLGLLPGLRAEPANQIVLDIPSTAEHPRNSEGSFIRLKSGRILCYFSQFYGGSQDASAARIAVIHSDDGGLSWSLPGSFAERGANQNLMSVSVLRLQSGRIALFYVVKKSGIDCRPYVRISSDETATWSPPAPVLIAPGYYVLNNDRVIQTSRGRLIVPMTVRIVNESRMTGTDLLSPGAAQWIDLWYYSDDEGASWRQSPGWEVLPKPDNAVGLQEPGVVELADGTLFGWARTDQGCQYGYRSSDGGMTWSAPEPTALKSPISPATIRRVPGSATLLAVFNDHSGRFPYRRDADPYGGRSPLVVALSYDGGRTWPVRRPIESAIRNEFAYTAIMFVGDQVLLAYSAAIGPEPHLGRLRIRRIALSWLR